MAVVRPLFLSFKLLPPAEVLSEFRCRLETLRCDVSQRHMFDWRRWHQSVSSRFEEYPGLLERMLRAGDRIDVPVFTLVFDRLSGRAAGEEGIHWWFGIRGQSRPFNALVKDAWTRLKQEGVRDPSGHRAHVTVSYQAPNALRTQGMAPVAWPIRDVLLIRSGGDLRAYEEVARWPLRPDPQLALW